VGQSSGAVAVFRGLPESVGPIHLAWVETVAGDVRVSDLPGFAQDKVSKGMPADSRPAADQIVTTLRQQANECRGVAAGGATPSATPTPSLTATGTTLPVTSPAAASTTPPPGTAHPSTTVGAPAVTVNPQATSAVPSPSSTTAVTVPDCGRVNP